MPAVTSTSPGLASSPASRTALPYSALARMLTRALPPSVHSTGITASAPCGSIAPVMILIAVPGWRAYAPVSPAATSAVTGSVTGFSSVASATSSTSTAYPSMPELSNGGSGLTVDTSSASTRPCTSPRPSSVGVSGVMVPRISARCSSTGVRGSPPWPCP